MITKWDLVTQWVSAKAQIDALAEAIWRIEGELQARMEGEGASIYDTSTHEVELKTSTSYDQGRLTPLLELLSQEELEAAHAYEPEHEETRTVPAKWNLTHLKKFRRRGRDIAEIIERARFSGPTRLTIKEKK